MTPIRRALVPALVLVGATMVGTQQAPPAPAQQIPPATQTPGVPPAVPPVPGAPTAAGSSRAFTTGCGLLLHPVRPERVEDFERFLAYVRDALAKSTNPRVRSQANGWRFLRTLEPGPNGVALYVFLVDPAVPGAEYALGPILAEVYTDPAQLSEIWALYTGSVTSGGTLLNLMPVDPKAPPPIATPPANAPGAGQKPATPPAAVTPPAAPAPPTKAAAPATPVKC